MDDPKSPFHQDELSPEDLEVLRAFHALEEPASDMLQEAVQSDTPSNHLQGAMPGLDISSDDEMLVLFTTEAGEDIATMRLALQQLEQDERLDSPAFLALKRTAHKVAGTAAALGCDSMSNIARHMETVIKLLEGRAIVYMTGSISLVHAVGALESTLQSVVSRGYESINPLLELEEEYRALNIEILTGSTPEQLLPGDTAGAPFHSASQHMLNTVP